MDDAQAAAEPDFGTTMARSSANVLRRIEQGRDSIAAAMQVLLRRPRSRIDWDQSMLVDRLLQDHSLHHTAMHPLGTFMGVFVPCTCTLFGVVVFMRLGFVVSQVGLLYSLLLVVASFILALLTSLSMCALISDAGDRAMRGADRSDPGVYLALRTSVGQKLGAALGVAFYLAFMVDVCWYITGFAELLCSATKTFSTKQVFHWNPPGTWISTCVSSGTLLLLTAVSARGVRFSVRISLGILVLIILCIITSLVCLLVPTVNDKDGLTAFSWETLSSNMHLHPHGGKDAGQMVMSSFVLVFPGFTGILAGANLSGELRTPSKSIARGTIASLVFVVVTYALICATLAATVETSVLRKRMHVMESVVLSSLRVPIGQLGVSCTTLSSALSYLLCAPRVAQALARDSAWAPLSFLVPVSAHGQPLRALALTWLLSQAVLLTGTVDLLAPFVSGLFLLAFTLINLFCFVASLSRPNFAPKLRVHAKLVSLLGFILSFLAMTAALSASLAMTIASCALLLLLVSWQWRALFNLFMLGDRPSQAQFPSPDLDPPRSSRDVTDELLERAAVYVHDALRGRCHNIDWALAPHSRVRAQRTLGALRMIRWANVCIYMGLAFFERPTWCYSSSCGDELSVPTSGLPKMPLWASLALEAGCISVLSFEVLLKAYCMSSRLFFLSPWHVLQLLLLLLDVLGLGVTAVSPSTIPVFNPILRPLLFIAMSRRVRRSFGSFVRLLPLVFKWLVVVLLLLVLYALIGILLMGHTQPLLADAGGGFDDVAASLLSLTILLTTANFPDVMLQAYEKSRSTALFFVSFLLVCLFLLMNLVLATVFKHYKQSALARSAEAVRARDLALRNAFLLLDVSADGYVELEHFMRLVSRVQQPVFSLFDSETLSALDAAYTKDVLQKMLQRDEAVPLHGLAADAFCTCLLALKRRHWRDARDARDEDLDGERNAEARVRAGSACDMPADEQDEQSRAPEEQVRWILHKAWKSFISCASGCRRFVRAFLVQRSRSVERCMALVVLANGAVLAAEIELRAHGDHAAQQQAETVANPFFNALFTLEAVLKLWALGRKRYVASSANVFDGAVLLLTLSADAMLLARAHAADEAPFVLLARCSRLLRLLRLTVANEVFEHFLRLLPAFAGLLGALIALFTLYAQLGVLLFGGKLNTEDWESTPALDDTNPLFVLCNFNDFGSALLTLFELLVVNNWHVIMESVVQLTTEASRLYFVSWYVLAVTVMFNLVVAHVLDGFFEPDAAIDPEIGDVQELADWAASRF